MTQPSESLPPPTQPTNQDRENAHIRQKIAKRQADEYGEAQRLALVALGPGWKPWMKLFLIDSDHRRNGNIKPVATVYKVYRGAERISENAVYLRRMPDGQVAKADSYEPLLGDLLQQKHPTRTVEVRGQQVPVAHYELCWSALVLYHPKTAQELAERRATRERRKQEREDLRFAEENPLLAWAERAKQEDTPGEKGGRER